MCLSEHGPVTTSVYPFPPGSLCEAFEESFNEFRSGADAAEWLLLNLIEVFPPLLSPDFYSLVLLYTLGHRARYFTKSVLVWLYLLCLSTSQTLLLCF